MTQIIRLFDRKPIPEPVAQPVSAVEPTSEKIELHNGELIIYQRENSIKGVWQYRLTLPSGAYERKSTGKRELEDAKQVAEARWQESRWRDSRGLAERAVAFSDAASLYATNLQREIDLSPEKKNVQAQTRIHRINTLLIPFFKDKAIDAITTQDIQAFHDWCIARWKERVKVEYHLRKPSKLSMRRNDYLIRSILDHAVKQGHVTANEIITVQPTKTDQRRRGWFNDDEQALLLSSLEKRITETAGKPHQDARKMLWLWVRFMLLTGLRPGKEVQTLRLRDIEYRDGAKPHCLVKVRDGKRGPRIVVVSTEVWDIIQELKQFNPNPTDDSSLWTRPDGNAVERIDVSFTRLLPDLGLERDDFGQPRTPYSLRHSYASNRLNAGTNLDLLARNMGTSINMLQKHYSHITHLDHASELLK